MHPARTLSQPQLLGFIKRDLTCLPTTELLRPVVSSRARESFIAQTQAYLSKQAIQLLRIMATDALSGPAVHSLLPAHLQKRFAARDAERQSRREHSTGGYARRHTR